MEQKSFKYLALITALFVTVLIVSNLAAVKIIVVSGWVLTAGIVLFPLSYFFGDVLTEVYGFARARRVIWTGFFCNFLAVAFIAIAGLLPAAPFWPNQGAWDTILGLSPRIVAASFLAYLVGEFFNSYLMAKLKIATQGKLLWVRTIASTVVGEGLDSAIFLTVAFWGIFAPEEIAVAIVTQWAVKVAYEVAVTPLTYAAVRALKKAEGVDVYDRDTRFSPFRLR